MGKLVKGYWDCPYCGATGIDGEKISCPSCGRARGEVQFYMKDHAEAASREDNERADIEYVDEEAAKYINRNPDWYCSYCNSLNSDNAEKCQTCGSSRADSEANYFEMLKKKKEREQQNASAASAAPTRQASSKKPLLMILAIAVAVIALFSYMNGNKTQGDLQVTALEWVRNINIEENRKYSESGWTLPSGATLTDTRSELHHYDSVLDHYENVDVQRSRQVIDHYETYYTYTDKGNGFFEEVPHERPVYTTEYYTETVRQPVYRQVARYQDKYYYDIWRWTPSRDVTASGSDHNAAWPEYTLGDNEREGTRSQVYRFAVENKKDHAAAVYRLAEMDWRNLNVGDSIFITARRTGGDPYISDKNGNKIADLMRER